jgi:probable HAF family extracellular repeat protein
MYGRNAVKKMRIGTWTAAWILAAATVEARAEYAVVDLGALTNTATGSSATVNGINLATEISLTLSPNATVYHGMRYASGITTDLGTLGGANSYAAAINAGGQIVGRSQTTAGVTHSFLWTPGGTDGVAGNVQMKDLNPTGGSSQANAINFSGQIAGVMAVAGPGMQVNDRAYLYTNGKANQLPLPTTGNYATSYAYGINDAGKVVGEVYANQAATGHAFIYDGATSTELGDLGGGSSTALAINKNDKVVGYSANLDGFDRAFLYSDGAMTDLGTLGGNYAYANGINNNDQIVGGSFTDATDSIYHAFSSDGTTMTDLNTRITSRAADWVLTEAKDVNDAGAIVGVGKLLGAKHAFLLRPLAPGDATADGKVDFNDLVRLAQNYNSPDTLDWEHGDFTGDGHVDFNDLVGLAQNYNSVQFQTDVQAAFAPVPEPSAAGALVCAGVLGLMRRRRRKQG